MGRRRSISTDISTDPKLTDLAGFGPLPLLLYTWSIPHADDWGRMNGDARQFKLLVCPALDATAQQIDVALDQVASVGLWNRYEVDGHKYIAFPEDWWTKNQTYHATRHEWETMRRQVAPLIFKRDDFRCVMCESKKHLEVDHIHPVSKGGTNDLWNLQTLCRKCNRRKGAKA